MDYFMNTSASIYQNRSGGKKNNGPTTGLLSSDNPIPILLLPLQLSIPGFLTPPGIRWSPLSILYPHVQNSLTSLSRPLPLPDIGWDPIICTCSSPMSLHPFLSIHPCSLPHFTCPSPTPSLPALPPPTPRRPDIMSGHYLHSSRGSTPSIFFLFHFPLHPCVSPTLTDRAGYFMHGHIHT